MAEDLFDPLVAGLRPPTPPRQTAASAAAGMGVRALRSNPADAAIMQDPLMRLAPLVEPRPRIEQPTQTSGVFYNPALQQFSVGGQQFGVGDYDIALQTAGQIDRPAPPPPGEGWQRMAPSQYQQYLSSIAEGRGFFGNLGVGFQNLGEGVVGGVGRGLQMLGAEETGEAIAQFAEENIGLSPAEQARSAEISRNQSLLGQIGTAAVQSIPSLGLAIGGGVGAAGLAVRAGAAAGSLTARGAALGGVASSILPMELQSSWDAAEQGGYDTSDPEIRDEILLSALLKTAGQTVAPAFIAGGFSPALRRVVSESAQRTMGSRIARGVGAGALEGSAEAFAQIVDRVAFDPELRAEFNEADWAALGPLIVDRYGEEALVAFGAGFLLGGPLGALGTPTQAAAADEGATGEDLQRRRDVDSGQPVDALSGATLEPQATAEAAPPAAPEVRPEVAEAERLAAGWMEQPTILEGSDTGPLGPRLGALSPEDQALASGWAGQVLPPAPPAQPIAMQRTDLPPGAQMARSRARPTPPDFLPGVEPTQSIAQRRTDLAPGAQRLLQRPSERAETYAPAAAPAAETALSTQLNRLMAQARARQEAEAAEANIDTAPVVEPQPRETGEITAREYDAALAEWELVRREQRNPDAKPGLPRLNKKAQRQWAEAVRAGTADAELFSRLAKRTVRNPAPLVATPATSTATLADMDAMRQQVEAARAAEAADLEAARATLAQRGRLNELSMRLFDAQERALTSELQRRRAEPEVTPTPEAAPESPVAKRTLSEGVYGTKQGRPFKTALAANGQRAAVAGELTAELDQQVETVDLVAVRSGNGFGLSLQPETPTPPTGGRPTRTTPQEGAAKGRARRQAAAAKVTGGRTRAVQEQGAEARAVRQEPETGEGVRGEDTQGQEAAGARDKEAQDVKVLQRQLALSPAQKAALLTELDTDLDGLIDMMFGDPARVDAAIDRILEEGRDKKTQAEVAPTPAAEPTIQRGDSAPRDMGATEAWDKYVKPFLLVPVERTIISKGDPATAWKRAIEAGRGNVSTAVGILQGTVSYPVLEAQMILQQGTGVTAVDEDARDMALYNLLDTAFRGDTTGSKAKVLGDKSPVQFAQDTLAEHAWTDADREILLDFATDTEVVAARTAEKPNRQMQTLNALLEATGVLSTAENVDADTVSNPASDLTEEIVAYNEDPHTPVRWEQDRFREMVRALRAYAAENPAAYDSVVEGNTPLYQYLSGNSVRLQAGRVVPDARAVDPRTQERTAIVPEQVERGGAGIAAMVTRGGGKFSRVDYNDISNALDANGKPIAGPMPAGKQKLATKAFLKRLRNAPRVYSFKDQADLRRRDPALYRRAAAGRPEGDFDTANAAGYSFGDGEVIIFSDRIANEKHLKFVLAHETFGHYGLRGILPAAEFDTLMEGIYDASTAVQWGVDAAMRANPDLGKAEAVEEYLSDFAAAIDTSLVFRVWNAIKNALNRLGVTFGDDSVRYLLDQSRRYARSPLRGYPADLNTIAERAHAVETGTAAPGRYKSSSDFFKDNRGLDEFARMGLSIPRSLQEGFDAAGGKWGNFVEGWNGFKSTFLSLHGFDARTNPGLKRLHDILQQATSIAMAQRNTLNETMRPALNRGIFGFGGMTNAEYGRANELLHHARIRAVMALRENPVDSKAPLVVFNENTGQFERTDEVKRLDDMYRLTFEQARDGFSYTFTDLDSEGNVVGTETITVPGDPNLTRGSKVWLAYEAARKGYIDTELRLLIAQLSAGKTRESTALKEIGSVVPDGELNTEERALMRTAIRRYQELYEQGSSVNAEGAIVYVDSSIETAKEFAKAFNMAVIANEEAASDAEAQARNNAVRQFLDQSIADDVIAQIERFKQRATFGDDRFVVQNKVIGLHTQAMQEGGASDFAKNSIVAQYSPIVRTGDFETRLVAKDAKTGKVVSLDAGYKDGLLYSQFGSRDEAQAFAKQVRDAFGTTTYTVKARNADGQMVDTDVVFEPVVDKVLVEAANPLGVNLNEFVAGLNYFDINLRPEKREEIITAMTNQDAAARRRLRAGLNPGDARDAIAGIAEHIDGRASTIAKVQTRPLIDELMNLRLRESNALWAGNSAEVERLRERLEAVNADPSASDKVRNVAKREYEEALMMYRETNPEPGVSRKNVALNKAARTLAFLDQNASVNESDFEGSGFISAWRSYTSIIQLGGSLATGLLNPLSVYTNGVPYLASYNSKTAFGGGFGTGRALTEVQRAFKQVGIPGLKTFEGMNTAEFWDGPSGVASSPDLQKKYNVTKREAEFIAREIREGRMIPAQSNALVSTSRGRTTRGAFSKAIDLWMGPFNLTEQASRRAFGLASFRLEYARQREGIDPTLEPNSPEFVQAEQAAYDRAVDFAGRAMDTALGDYSVLNRPAFFRAGLPGILYMYKVFPTTSIQMFNNLSFNGKMGMLAALWVLGGVAAFPFAEDFEDLFDTLLQKADVGEGSVRAWAAKRLEDISPGLSPLVLKGALGNVLPGDIAGRVSLSVIPGTEALLAGSNVTRALEEIAGPMPSALLGSMQFAADLVRAPFSETVTMERVMREAPVTGLRMAADAYAYAQSGAIIDRRGYIVADDVSTGELLFRLAGFYPRRAAESFGNVRIINRMANYRREAAMAYRQEWVTARIRNDRERMREIEDAVRDWNSYHRGGPLVIDNFRDSARRAYREATRPAAERALRSVPQASRDQLTAIADALTF